MIKVKSKIEISDKRGNICPGDFGECSSKVPQSSGKIPVWWKKHGKNPFYWYPLWMRPEEIEFVN